MSEKYLPKVLKGVGGFSYEPPGNYAVWCGKMPGVDNELGFVAYDYNYKNPLIYRTTKAY